MSHLSAAFGLPEVCAELIELLNVPEFERAWLLYCELYNGTDEQQKAALGESFGSINLQQGHARLTAYAANRKKDAALAARAWKELTEGRSGYGARQQFKSNRDRVAGGAEPGRRGARRLDELHGAVGACRHRVPGVRAQDLNDRVPPNAHLAGSARAQRAGASVQHPKRWCCRCRAWAKPAKRLSTGISSSMPGAAADQADGRIAVPSCWEQQGFGAYYYGTQGRGKPDDDPVIPKETGTYRREFQVPADWAGRDIHIVFEAAMTDTSVTINGQSAGPAHQGGFYRFSYDITNLVKPGRNEIEVVVSKESANKSVNHAERRGDYWTFGGIYRPGVAGGAAARSHRLDRDRCARRRQLLCARASQSSAAPAGARLQAQVFDAAGKPFGDALRAEADSRRHRHFPRRVLARPRSGTRRRRISTR